MTTTNQDTILSSELARLQKQRHFGGIHFDPQYDRFCRQNLSLKGRRLADDIPGHLSDDELLRLCREAVDALDW